MRRRGTACPILERSAFAGFRFPPEVITVAVRWYLRYALSYRDVEELLAERGVEADHVTAYRWVQRFTPLFVDAARPLRHATGDQWFVDETYVKVAGHLDQEAEVAVLDPSTGTGRSTPALHAGDGLTPLTWTECPDAARDRRPVTGCRGRRAPATCWPTAGPTPGCPPA